MNQPGNNNFSGANARRAVAAAAAVMPKVLAALATEGIRPDWRDVLQARADHPEASTAQLAARTGLTKHQFTGRMRDALRWAERRAERMQQRS